MKRDLLNDGVLKHILIDEMHLLTPLMLFLYLSHSKAPDSMPLSSPLILSLRSSVSPSLFLFLSFTLSPQISVFLYSPLRLPWSARRELFCKKQ